MLDFIQQVVKYYHVVTLYFAMMLLNKSMDWLVILKNSDHAVDYQIRNML